MFMAWGMYHGSLLFCSGLYFWAVISYERDISVKWMQTMIFETKEITSRWGLTQCLITRENKKQKRNGTEYMVMMFLTSGRKPETWSMGPEEECFKRVWLHVARVFFIRSLFWLSVDPMHVVPRRSCCVTKAHKVINGVRCTSWISWVQQSVQMQFLYLLFLSKINSLFKDSNGVVIWLNKKKNQTNSWNGEPSFFPKQIHTLNLPWVLLYVLVDEQTAFLVS